MIPIRLSLIPYVCFCALLFWVSRGHYMGVTRGRCVFPLSLRMRCTLPPHHGGATIVRSLHEWVSRCRCTMSRCRRVFGVPLSLPVCFWSLCLGFHAAFASWFRDRRATVARWGFPLSLGVVPLTLRAGLPVVVARFPAVVAFGAPVVEP